MLEIPGKMQVTLVAFYGEKPKELLHLIQYLQNLLAERLLSAFHPYQLEQVHGTIIGLEGHRGDTSIHNLNSDAAVAPSLLLSFLRSPDFRPTTVRIGGYRHYHEYPFQSRGMHPYLRSFSIQGAIAVAMGWPASESQFPTSLDELRRQFESRLAVRHKWHRKPGDVDNCVFRSKLTSRFG